MRLLLPRIPSLTGPSLAVGRAEAGRASPRGTVRGWGAAARLAPYRAVILGYCQLLAGAGGRLALQMVYFFVLANTLPLAEMGVFASVSAAGVLIGCLAGLGFQSHVMRAATGRPRCLGGYLGAYYLCFALALPVMFALAGGLYALLFRETIALPAYLAIIVVEVALWREIELLVQVNNGLGRFSAASTLVSMPVGFRAAAAVAFWAAGGGDAETWSAYYLAGNAAAVVVLGLAFHPRVRLRLRARLLRGRLRDGLLYASSYLLYLAQSEIDKLIVLSLAGERAAGIYAIAMRLIDLTAVPLRPVFMMYSRKIMMARTVTRALLRECLRIEGIVAAVSTGLLLALVAGLHLVPGLLGANVATASGMLGAILVVPAVRNLLEFHGELFFAFGNMAWRAGVTAALVVLKAGAVALLLTLTAAPTADPTGWGLWLNGVYLGLYAISFGAVYRLLVRGMAA